MDRLALAATEFLVFIRQAWTEPRWELASRAPRLNLASGRGCGPRSRSIPEPHIPPQKFITWSWHLTTAGPRMSLRN